MMMMWDGLVEFFPQFESILLLFVPCSRYVSLSLFGVSASVVESANGHEGRSIHFR